MQLFPIFLALHPTLEATRDTKDALYEFPNPQTAASYLFQTKPPSSLSRNWDIVIVIDQIAYRFSVDGGARFIPIKSQAWRSMKRENLDWRYPKIGSTAYGIDEITRKAIQISWPMKYSLYPETAQKFSHALFESIRLPIYSPNPVQLLKTLPGDLLSGLDHTPNPVSTLVNRLKCIILITFLNFHHYLFGLTSKLVLLPLKRLGVDAIWTMEVMKAACLTFLFLGKISLKLLVGMVVLVVGRDVEKAEHTLRGLAEEVRRFDVLERVIGARDTRPNRGDLIVFRKL